MTLKQIYVSCFLALTTLSGFAQTGRNVIDLWPGGPLTSNGITTDTARLSIFLPTAEKATGRAIIICPGGGYAHLAFEKEGTSWAPLFNELGIATIVLKYRMPNGIWQVPIEDAEETVRLVRRHAEEWNINPNDVGIMGFSAGGHLASTVATHAHGDARPNFQLLFYPVISMEKGITHQGSRDNLLGVSPSEELVTLFCNEQQVSAQTPPAFIALADDDRVVIPENAVNYYSALKANGIPASLHIYPKGGHGFGSNLSFPYHTEMLLDLKAWLQAMK